MDPSYKMSPSQQRRRKAGKREEDDKSDELRVCPVCEELFVRSVNSIHNLNDHFSHRVDNWLRLFYMEKL